MKSPSLTMPSWLRGERLAAWALVALLLLGLFIVRDYGISTDEQEQRHIGLVSLRYLAERYNPQFMVAHPEIQKVPDLHTFWDRDYGVAFELPMVWLEMVLGLTDWRDIIFFRHICTFLVNLGGVVALYQLARRRFADWRLGLLAATLLVASPRIFADFFYNSKDAVFLTVFAVATNTAVNLLQRPGWRQVLWHALACAVAIDIRIMAVLIPGATLVMLALQAAHGAYAGQRPQLGLKVPVYLGLLAGVVVLLWPYLWEAPLLHFTEAFHNMSQFRWDGFMRYFGYEVRGSKLPWHYAEAWISITTPILYLVGFVAGTFLIVRQLVRRGWRLYATDAEWQDLLFLGLTLAPLVAVIVLHSVLYNAWRQLYFVYPTLLLVAVRGLVGLARWQPARPRWQRLWPQLCRWVLAASLLLTTAQMVWLHPFQHLYFNVFAKAHPEERFDGDYWMLSYRTGLEWILAHDNRPHIGVSAQRVVELDAARRMLPLYARDRFTVLEESLNGEYYLTTYDNHAYPYEEYDYKLTDIYRGGQRVITIFRTRWHH